MAFPFHPRAKVRLRLQGATALMRRASAASLLCALADLSEEGCHCCVSLDDVDGVTAESWRGVLAKGLLVTLEISEPPELRGLVFDQAEVRWVELRKSGDTEFGLRLSTPKPEQKHILASALLGFAAAKLRRGATLVSGVPAAGGAGETPPLPGAAVPAAPLAPEEKAGAEQAPPQPESPGARRVFVVEPHEMQLDGVARQRPRRLKLSLPVVFEFCGADRAEWEQGLHQGSTVDVSEGGIMLEGPAPDFCHPTELVGYKTCVAVTIRAGDRDVKGFCAVRSAVPSGQKEDHWLYGMQIIEMSVMDRQILYRIFAGNEAESAGEDEG